VTEEQFAALKSGDVIKSRYGLYAVVGDATDKGPGAKKLRREDAGPTWDSPTSAGSYEIVSSITQTHYTVPGIPESWEVVEALQASWPKEIVFHLGNVGKYWFRLGRKQGASVESDLKKLIDYAQRALKVLSKQRG
jgi:hypothetical protein